MRAYMSLFLGLLLMSCSGSNEDSKRDERSEVDPMIDTVQNSVDSSTVSKDPDGTWAMMDAEGAEEARFDIYASEYRLQIYDLAASDTQVIDLITDIDIENELPDNFLDFRDYNFDGYGDFSYRVIEGSGVAHREYWVKDPSNNKFIRHDALSDMPASIINKEDSTLVNFSSSMAGMHYTRKTFAPEGLTNLTLLTEETQGAVDQESEILYYKKINYTNNGPVVACYMVISVDDKLEQHCIEEGADCPDEFIYLDPGYDEEVRMVEVDGPCSE